MKRWSNDKFERSQAMTLPLRLALYLKEYEPDNGELYLIKSQRFSIN